MNRQFIVKVTTQESAVWLIAVEAPRRIEALTMTLDAFLDRFGDKQNPVDIAVLQVTHTIVHSRADSIPHLREL